MKFERIHPFSDGNGRTGRAIMVYACLLCEIPPCVIRLEDQERYIACLRDFDEADLTDLCVQISDEEAVIAHGFTDFPDDEIPLVGLDLNRPNRKLRE